MSRDSAARAVGTAQALRMVDLNRLISFYDVLQELRIPLDHLQERIHCHPYERGLAHSILPAQAQKLSSELIGHLGANPRNWSRVHSLGHLVEAKQRRRADDDLTLLKSLGTGVLDLSVGIEVYRKVVNAGVDKVEPL